MRSLSIQVASFMVAISLAYNLGLVWSSSRDTLVPEGEAADLRETDQVQVHPSVTLCPAEVVRMQVEALGRCLEDELALRQVYAFASPDNKEVTGPLSRFARMLLSPRFRPIIKAHRTVIGATVAKGDYAAVTVTTISSGLEVHVYRFYLARQTESPHDGCWMTYGVKLDEQASRHSADESQPISI